MSINRPRSAQINDLKQHYTILPGLLTGSEVTITDLPPKTVTQVLGGAVESSPATLVFPNPGPYALVAGNEFTIYMPDVNGNNPFTVQIQGSDLVFSTVPTAKLVARINSVASAYLGYNIASVSHGRVKITSYNNSGLTTGATSRVTIACTTNLFEYFGYAAGVTSVTEYGADANTRGIVTKSASGLGGQVLLKASNPLPGRGSVSTPLVYDNSVPAKVLAGYGSRATELIDIWRFVKQTVLPNEYSKYFVDPGDGGEVTGYITATSSTSVRFNSSRVGQLKPKLYTSSSSPSTFNTITTGDTFTIEMSSSVVPSAPFTYTHVFSASPVSVSDLISTINTAFITATESYPQAVTDRSGPYNIPNGSFTIKFGATGSLVEVYFSSPSGYSERTASALAIAINQAIAYFAPGQGQAYVIQVPANSQTGVPRYEAVSIVSSSTDYVNTYVEIGAGRTNFNLTPPLVASGGTFLGSLEAIGIKPGFYGAGYLVEPFGADEIAFVNHARETGAYIKITGNPTTLSRLGILANSQSFSVQGEESISVSESFVLIPEIMTLGEVPVAADRIYSSFQDRGKQDPIPAYEGIKNVANNPGVSPGGQSASGSNSYLDSLALGSLLLGANLTNASAQLQRARTTALTNGDIGWTLLYVAQNVGSLNMKVRMYVNQAQELYVTLNCYISGSTWQRDVSGTAFRSKVPVNGPIFEFNLTDTSWTESGWYNWGSFGDPSSFDAIFNIVSDTNNGVALRPILSGIFSALVSFQSTQSLTTYETAVANSTLRTKLYGSGLFLSFNADIDYSSSVFNVTKDVAGPSWVLQLNSGNDASLAGITLYYDATSDVTLGLTDYTEVFSTNSTKYQLGAPLKFTDDLVGSGEPLVGHTANALVNYERFASTGSTYYSFTTRYNTTQGQKIEGFNVNFSLTPNNATDPMNYPAITKTTQTALSGIFETYRIRVTSPTPEYRIFSQKWIYNVGGYSLRNNYYLDQMVPLAGSYRIKDVDRRYTDTGVSKEVEFSDFYFLSPGSKFTPDSSADTPVRIRTLNDGGDGYQSGLWYNNNRKSALLVEHVEGTRLLTRPANGGAVADNDWVRTADFDLSTALAFRLSLSVVNDGVSTTVYTLNKYNAYEPNVGTKIYFKVGNEAKLDLASWISIPAIPYTTNFNLTRGTIGVNTVIVMHVVDTWDVSTNSIVIRSFYQDFATGGGWTQIQFSTLATPFTIPFEVTAFGLKPNT